jgi:hypothetical protein
MHASRVVAVAPVQGGKKIDPCIPAPGRSTTRRSGTQRVTYARFHSFREDAGRVATRTSRPGQLGAFLLALGSYRGSDRSAKARRTSSGDRPTLKQR